MMIIQIPGEDFGDDSGFSGIQSHARRVTRSFRIDSIAVWRSRPGKQRSSAQFRQSPTAHTFSDQCPLVFSDRAANLQQQLIVWVLAHRAIQKLHPATMTLEFL